MAAVRHLEFSKVGNFNFRSHSEAQYASPIQISQISVEPFWRYGRFSILKMTAAAILFFENFKFLTVGTLKRVELRLRAKFLSKSIKMRLKYGDFSIFQDGGRPQFEPLERPNRKKFEFSKIQHGGGRYLEKSKIRHISAAVQPILTKFGKVMHFERLDRLDR